MMQTCTFETKVYVYGLNYVKNLNFITILKITDIHFICFIIPTRIFMEELLTFPHILYTFKIRTSIYQSMESNMSKSMLIIFSIFSTNAFYHRISNATPIVHTHQSACSYTDIHKSPYYWMHLWEERLRDEYSHVQNNLITIEEYNVMKKNLASVFRNQYSHELKYSAYDTLRTLRKEGILLQVDEEEYAAFMINMELKIHEQG